MRSFMDQKETTATQYCASRHFVSCCETMAWSTQNHRRWETPETPQAIRVHVTLHISPASQHITTCLIWVSWLVSWKPAVNFWHQRFGSMSIQSSDPRLHCANFLRKNLALSGVQHVSFSLRKVQAAPRVRRKKQCSSAWSYDVSRLQPYMFHGQRPQGTCRKSCKSSLAWQTAKGWVAKKSSWNQLVPAIFHGEAQ